MPELKYPTPKSLKSQVDKFFDHCEAISHPPTITGLCKFLDLTNATLAKYHSRPDYTPIIDSARTKIEHAYELLLLDKGRNPAGIIFILKNHFNWKDKREIEQTFNIPLPMLGEKLVSMLINHPQILLAAYREAFPTGDPELRKSLGLPQENEPTPIKLPNNPRTLLPPPKPIPPPTAPENIMETITPNAKPFAKYAEILHNINPTTKKGH